MRTLISLAMLLGLAAVAQPALCDESVDEFDVSGDADAKAMQQDLTEISTTILPCLIQASGNGKSDAEAESSCFCENRSFVESHLADLKSLRAKHPEWEGKTLKIVSGPPDDRETHRFGDPQIAEIESSLQDASKTCQ